MSQSIHIKTHVVGRRPPFEPCKCRERFNRPWLFGFVLQAPKAEHGCILKIKTERFFG